MLKIALASAVVLALTSCAPNTDPGGSTDTGSVGYAYHDGLHSNQVVSPSPQALEAARRGVYLWPPAENARPD